MVKIELTSKEIIMAQFALIEYKKLYNKTPLEDLKIILSKVENDIAVIKTFCLNNLQETKIKGWCLQHIILNYNNIETLKRNIGAL